MTSENDRPMTTRREAIKAGLAVLAAPAVVLGGKAVAEAGSLPPILAEVMRRKAANGHAKARLESVAVTGNHPTAAVVMVTWEITAPQPIDSMASLMQAAGSVNDRAYLDIARGQFAITSIRTVMRADGQTYVTYDVSERLLPNGETLPWNSVVVMTGGSAKPATLTPNPYPTADFSRLLGWR